MLDVSTSMEGNLPVLRSAASELFTRLRPEDVVRVGTFGKQILITPSFAHDADELRAALPTVIAPDAPTALWLALDQAMTTFGGPDERRPVILVLSDGQDSQSLRERQMREAEVIERARREDVMIYAVGMRSAMRGRVSSPESGATALSRFPQVMIPNDLPDPGLRRVAQDTGGGYTEIRLGEDLAAAFARVAEELHGQYLLGFEPPRRDGTVHRIDVRLVAQGGMKPRGRRSYAAPQP
jgi:VWFA-related protein